METATEPVTIIEPASKRRAPPWRELWENRGLIAMMVLKAVRARYHDTWLGVLWAIIQPLTYMLVLNLFFGIYAKVYSGQTPYLLFLLTGLVPFQFFTKSANEGAGAIRNNAALINKLYLPRLVFPLAVIGTAAVDFVVALGLLFAMMALYHLSPTINMVALPFLLLILLMAGCGVAVLLSILTVYFNDLRVAVPVILQIWFFATPIVYQANVVPESARIIFGLNPMVGLVEAFRWCLLGLPDIPDLRLLIPSFTIIVLLFVGSLLYFRRTESLVADIV
jgi:lipopolysaccharide transport system permease protein